jgi:pilus assembly protein CpaD
MNAKSSAPLLALAALTLGACASKPAPVTAEGALLATRADLHNITVRSVDERLQLPVSAAEAEPNPSSLRMASVFGAQFVSEGAGVLSIQIPRNSANAAAARALADRATEQIIAEGAPATAISLSYYEAGGQSEPDLVLSYARFQADGPECPSVGESDLAHSFGNRPWAAFGCARAANLAAMIADPADLKGPREAGPSDTARRQAALEKYREGGQIHSTRSTDERVTISDAVR